MKISVLAVGTKMPAWVDAALKDYQKRLPKEWRFDFKEIALGQRNSNSIERAVAAESQAILKHVKPSDFVVALAVEGRSWATEELARKLTQWEVEIKHLVLLIGGPDGLSHDCLNRANVLWSLSALTMPHSIVRVLLVEQLYRAWTINQNHPYHRA